VRMTGMMARRILAGAFLALVMTLSLAGLASAQSSNSDSNSNSNSNTNSSSGTTTTSHSSTTAGLTTARTGAEMWIPLMLGGLVITIAVATRVGLSRAASRTP
jgi:hypothetical protein